MAISVVVAVGDAADPLVEAIKERLPKVKVGDGIDPSLRDGPARHARAPRQGRVVPRLRARRRARSSSPTAARPRRTATASSSASRSSTTSRRRWTPIATRSSARSSPWCGAKTYDEALRLVNENPYGNGVALFTRDGGVARQFQFDVNVGMVGINVPDPGPRRLLLVRRLEELPLRRPAHLRAGGDRLLHADEGGHEPLAGPGDEQGRPRLPADALGRARPLHPADRRGRGRGPARARTTTRRSSGRARSSTSSRR